MIRTCVVDDDFMSASIHRSYVERIAGFEAVGEAHTGAEALELVRRVRPDLVLLDIYLPDISGLDVIRRLRQDEDAAVDVIAVTAAKDVKTLRAAMQGGVVHYLVKPFLFETFRDRLERYAALKQRLDRLREADQGDVDHLFSLLRVEGRARLPKGISAPTLSLVVDSTRSSDGEVSAVEVAERAGISRGTARRYLEYLESLGSVELTLRYGATGRPEHLYRWSGAVSAG
ncbi:MAG: response regulator [Actinobacteria bacterium]|nr:response regulator [Actinomycetota bacterium]